MVGRLSRKGRDCQAHHEGVLLMRQARQGTRLGPAPRVCGGSLRPHLAAPGWTWREVI